MARIAITVGSRFVSKPYMIDPDVVVNLPTNSELWDPGLVARHFEDALSSVSKLAI